MARIAILERSDMNAEQARVYDAAKQSSGIVGGPYYAYIRLPKVFEACQNLRASLSSGPLTPRFSMTCMTANTFGIDPPAASRLVVTREPLPQALGMGVWGPGAKPNRPWSAVLGADFTQNGRK